MRRLLRPSLLSLLTATAACAGNTSSGGAAPDTTAVSGNTETASGGALRIENRTNQDRDIYIRAQSRGPIRVGFVPGGETATFKLSPAMLSGTNSFRIEARPISGGGGSTTVSEPFNVRVGEETFWSIPP
ncbi:MAG TPA: hypothetical protein VFT28_13115 [Gemmatimonadales bacterium]|nr:hypothetical protein [Gemmatimonadales bacterium]